MNITQILVMRGEAMHHETVARGLRTLTAGNHNTWQIRTYRKEAEDLETKARCIEEQIAAALAAFPELQAQFDTLTG